uniref:PIN domain-containing protein n=1 Tax=uncultured bacterium 5G4 TaxID=1701326 RepID=A0A166H3T7_9BACT|nr:hypothetical protein 5G4_041 [uncultured bacterium 5G4]
MFLDTNVLFSGFHSLEGTAGLILRACREGIFEGVISDDVIHEVVGNLARKSPGSLNDIEPWLEEAAPDVAPHPTFLETEVWFERGFGPDAPIAAAAYRAEVDFLCTGDRLFRERWNNLQSTPKAVSPRELLEFLELT